MSSLFSRALERIRASARGIGHELQGGYKLAADTPSLLRFSADVLLSRLVRLPAGKALGKREHTIRVKGGVTLRYRLNRGDMQSIREVWIDEVYRLPFDVVPKHLVDLGANIGLSSVWFARHYGCQTIVAIEPSPENARLARLNLELNNIPAEVVEAAVGASDGTVYFADSDESNLGHVAHAGRPVQQVSMRTVLERLPAGAEIDVLKMDIEGGEGPLLAASTDLAWLGRVKAIIAETHRDIIDFPAMVQTLESQGFRYLPAHAGHQFDGLDGFVRPAS